MATPAVFADGTPLSAANLNKFVNAESKSQVKINYGHVKYTGTAWQLAAGHDSAGAWTFTWDATNGELQIGGLSGFTSGPVPLATRFADSVIKGYSVAVNAKSVSPFDTLFVRFYDSAGTQITIQDTKMNFFIFCIGV